MHSDEVNVGSISFSAVPRPACSEPSMLCRHSSVCLSQAQLCDGNKDCPEGEDEDSCVTACLSKGATMTTVLHPGYVCVLLLLFFLQPMNPEDFRCQDGRSCISRNLVCDGHFHCRDGSDEMSCSSITSLSVQAKVPKCRLGAKLCDDGRECVLHRHVCDGEVDCKDGSDEHGCGASAKAEMKCSFWFTV